jgi:type II secretory ATPase GspE/PulE/Tfp pilus assembly ATPase PilB-like protein
MNQRLPVTPEEISRTTAAGSLLSKWGHDNHAPQDIIEMAHLSTELMSLRAGEAVVRMGFTDKATVEAALKEKPAATPTLEYLAERIEGIRPEIQRIISLQDGMPYYRHLGLAHSALQDNRVMQTCAKLEATLITTPNGEPCLVFLEHAIAKRYGNMGRQEQSNDPIRQVLNKTPILAVGARNVVLSRIKMEYAQAGDFEQTHITPSTATTNIQRQLVQIFEYAIDKKASNIAIQPDMNGMSRVRIRRHGLMIPIPMTQTLPPEVAMEMANVLHGWSNAAYTGSKERVQGQLQGPAGGQFTFRTSDVEVFFRASFTLPDSLGGPNLESISLRILPREELRVRLSANRIAPEVITALDDAVREEQGIVLLVGATGSGKSTTIHGALDLHYDIYGDSKNRLTLEDPVERLGMGLVPHSISKAYGFDLMMAEILRQDPDVIFLGEMRDRASASIGIRAAGTGHLVFSTLHANNSLMAIGALRAYINNRYVDNASAVMVSDFDMVNSLSLVVAQKLVPELCPHCSVPTPPEMHEQTLERLVRYVSKHGLIPAETKDDTKADERKAMIADIVSVVRTSKQHSPEGCKHCDNTGFMGELPINEVFTPDYQCKQLMIDMLASNRMQMERLKPYRGPSLFEAALALVRDGRTHLNSLYL